MQRAMNQPGLNSSFFNLRVYLGRVPAVRFLSAGDLPGQGWWSKLDTEIEHPLAWHVVQGLGHVLDYLSLDERMPTVFKPVSLPYMNDGLKDYLGWVTECCDPGFLPDTAAPWLEGGLPRPVDDLAEWDTGDDDAD